MREVLYTGEEISEMVGRPLDEAISRARGFTGGHPGKTFRPDSPTTTWRNAHGEPVCRYGVSTHIEEAWQLIDELSYENTPDGMSAFYEEFWLIYNPTQECYVCRIVCNDWSIAEEGATAALVICRAYLRVKVGPAL